jgi:hypothetical protein
MRSGVGLRVFFFIDANTGISDRMRTHNRLKGTLMVLVNKDIGLDPSESK